MKRPSKNALNTQSREMQCFYPRQVQAGECFKIMRNAAIKGIQAMNRPTVLIGGGYDKDSSYDEWIEAFDGKVKKLVLLGATREKIAQTARRLGFSDIVMADSFEEAFEKCVEYAEPGDAVLLSPACASCRMYKNYEEPGDKFKELVNEL